MSGIAENDMANNIEQVGGRGPDPGGGPHRMPMLLWFLAVHCGMGVAMGVAFASLIVMANIAGIRDLLIASSEPFIPMFLFYASCALTFGSAKMGIAVMSLPFDPPDEDDDKPRTEEGPDR